MIGSPPGGAATVISAASTPSTAPAALEHAVQHLVEVDRPGELSEHPRALASCCVRSIVSVSSRTIASIRDSSSRDSVWSARLRDATSLTDPEDEQRDPQRGERCTDGGDGDHHRLTHKLAPLMVSAVPAKSAGRGGFHLHCNRHFRGCL
jgi:hypothetical protein